MTTIEKTKENVDKVVLIMKDNMNSILVRDQKLQEIDDKAQNLQENANKFGIISAKLKRKMWWKNTKIIIIVTMVILILILIISLIIWGTYRNK